MSHDEKHMLKAQAVYKMYREGEKSLAVLQGVDLSLAPQKKTAIVGASGVGKSTLLHVLGGLETPNKGQVFVGEEDLYKLSEKKRARLRNRFFGFVFQFYHLLPELTVLENVLLPTMIASLSGAEGEALAGKALERVGLTNKAGEFPSVLSGGEQQRVAIARACVLSPKLILADEPTGNLDHETGAQVLKYLLECVEKSEGSLILVTHNPEIAKTMDQIFELKDGKLLSK